MSPGLVRDRRCSIDDHHITDVVRAQASLFTQLGATADCVSILTLRRESGLARRWHYKIPHMRTDSDFIMINKLRAEDDHINS